MNKKLYIIVGPTASGKTSLAISLAEKLHTEIVSADSRQIFRQMNIGVARPSKQELQRVKHHLIAVWNIEDTYNVKRYETEAINIIEKLFNQYDNLVLCGGSGLYIDAIINGIDTMPDANQEIKLELNKELNTKGLESLLEELKQRDFDYYSVVDKQNHRRIIRALEVIRTSGKPFSYFINKEKVKRNFDIKIIGIYRNRAELIDRINYRVDKMMNSGLLEEVKKIEPFRNLNAVNTIGYKELFDYFDNKCSLDEAIEQIKIHTRQYAKRQMTWFKRNKQTIWLDVTNNEFNINYII